MAAEWEHVEQITGNTNEVEVWSLFDQPSKPVKAEMKVGGDKKLHGFGKCSFKVVEMSSIVAGPRCSVFPLIVMSNPTVVFDPYAAADLSDIVQTIVDNHNVAITGQAEWYPVAFFLRAENGEILGGLLGDIWAAWLHVRTLAVAAPARGHGFGRELMRRAELYAVERGCTDAFLDTFSFQAKPFYEKLGYRVFGMLENHPVGHQHYFMTKKLDFSK